MGGRSSASVKKSSVGSSGKINMAAVSVYSEIPNPRGFGNWYFKLGNTGEEVSFSGKYSDAKKKAVKYAAEKGARRITALR